MARVTSPLFGLRGRGAIGKSIVFANWKGIQYARTLVIPANPRTDPQMATRHTFMFLSELYRALPSGAQEPWRNYAMGKPITDRNAIISRNLPLLRGETDITTFVASPGTYSGPALLAFEVAAGAGAGAIQATWEAPDPLPEWEFTGVRLLLLKDQEPTPPLAMPPVFEESALPGDSKTWSGLGTGNTFVVAAWPVWTRPDGKIAHGPSLVGSAQTT